MASPTTNASNIQQFRLQTGNFAYAKVFALSIPDFKGFGGDAHPHAQRDTQGVASKLNAYARSFALPGAVMNPKQVIIQHGLPPINISDSVTFAPWTVTFIDEEALTIRKFFETWMGASRLWNDHSYATPVRYKANGAVASVLDMEGNPVHSYHFFGMFPTDISPITVGQDNNNLIEFSVTFYYDFYRFKPYTEPNPVKASELPKDSEKNAQYVKDQKFSAEGSISPILNAGSTLKDTTLDATGSGSINLPNAGL